MKIGVIGAGTWGIALARMLTNSNHDVIVWSAIESEIDELEATRTHKNLPGSVIPEATRFTKNLKDAVIDKVGNKHITMGKTHCQWEFLYDSGSSIQCSVTT